MRAWRTLILLVGLMAATLPAEEERYFGRYSREHLERGVIKFQKVRNIGLAVMGAGAAVLATGIVLASTADYPTQREIDAGAEPGPGTQTMAGVITIFAGTAMIPPGLVTTIIGVRNRNKYEGMLEAISLKYDLKPDRRGVVMAWSF